MDGEVWEYVDKGYKLPGCHDSNTKIKNTFEKPVYAKVLRIVPYEYFGHKSLRFDALYTD